MIEQSTITYCEDCGLKLNLVTNEVFHLFGMNLCKRCYDIRLRLGDIKPRRGR